VILLICIYVGTGGLFVTKPTGFIPTEDGGVFMTGITLPEGSSAARTNEVLTSLEKEFTELFPEINNITAISGMNLLNRAFKSSGATFFIQLKPWGERNRSVADILAVIKAKYGQYPHATILAVSPPAVPGLGMSGGFSMMVLDQKGSDIKDFEAVVGQFLAKANQRPEIGMAYTLFSSRTPNYEVTINREQVKKMGVSIGQLYGTLSAYLGSSYVNDFTKYGRNYRVVTQADTTYRMHIEDIQKLYVKNQQGQPVPIGSLVSYQKVEKPASINHYNMFRSIEVSGSAAPGYSSGDVLNALEEVALEVLPEGYVHQFSGLSLQEKMSGNTTILIFALCIVFVFLLLAALYESWSVPFSILLSVPLGLFGAILTLMFIPALDNNIYAQIGLVTIIGLAAKNAILIVEFAKERVDLGMGIIPSTIEAVKLRLRPIIMTSLAFILGIIPLMYSAGAGAISRQTIGWTVFGGMLIATFLAIFIVPVLFVLISKIAYSKEKLAKLEEEYKKSHASGHEPHGH
jgi:HAE1 family hydrophobic/amphiphilic exporter-1